MTYLKKYTKGDIFTLFLIVSFPIHIWSIFLVFQDFQWVMERTASSWDATGYAAYSLSFALIESIIITLVVWLLGFFLPKRWEVKQVIAVLGTLIFSTSLWAILNQLYFFYADTHAQKLHALFINTHHPVRWYVIFAAAVLGLVAITIIGPIFLTYRGDKFTKIANQIFDRIIILSALYLILDIAGIIVVIIRNV